MTWKRRHRSFYTRDFPDPADPELATRSTALLVVDVQHVFLDPPDSGSFDADDMARSRAWEPFRMQVRERVVPNVARLLGAFRARDGEVAFVRIGGQRDDGRDRPRARRMPGNAILLADDPAAQIPQEIASHPGEFVATKTSDSALAGTGLELWLRMLGITHVVVAGVLTDQCVSSTVRALADADFSVVLVEDACAAGTEDIHVSELATLNLLYCLVMAAEDVLSLLHD